MRANRTLLCPRCAVRFDVGPACPVCRRAKHVLDGTDARVLPEARAALRAHGGWRRWLAPMRVESWSPTREARARAVVGVARGKETLRAPITRTPCLAWRLIGRGPTGALDEAGAASFEVEATDGPSAEIDATAIGVAIAVGEPAPITLDPPLAALLARLFAFPTDGRFELAEGLLRDGDRVRVEGAAELAAASDGYRGAREVLRFRDGPGAPLVVSSARGASDEPDP